MSFPECIYLVVVLKSGAPTPDGVLRVDGLVEEPLTKEGLMAGSGTNIVVLTGNLTKDPVLPYEKAEDNARWMENLDDKRACRISLAVDRPTKKGAESKADYVDIALFGASGRTAAAYLKKGRLVLIEGTPDCPWSGCR